MKKLVHIVRDHHLTSEEADKYDKIRAEIELEYGHLRKVARSLEKVNDKHGKALERMENSDDLFLLFLERNNLTREQLETQIVFDKTVFMGAGDPTDPRQNFTGQDIAALRYMLETAISHVGGMQQRRHPDEPDASKNIEILLQNINNALSWPKDQNP